MSKKSKVIPFPAKVPVPEQGERAALEALAMRVMAKQPPEQRGLLDLLRAEAQWDQKDAGSDRLER
jgi:hypothetical protein